MKKLGVSIYPSKSNIEEDKEYLKLDKYSVTNPIVIKHRPPKTNIEK